MSPLLFVFEHICTDSLNFVHDLESYPELLESDWLLFWKAKGEDIVKASWFKLYSDYVIQEEEHTREGSNINEPEESLANLTINQEVSGDNSEEIQQETLANQGVTIKPTTNEDIEETVAPQSWQELWDEHYLKIYESTYRIYEIVHYNQYCFHRPHLVEVLEEKTVDETEYEVELINQEEELKALGLPVSFRGRGYKNQQKTHSDSETFSEEETDMSPIQEHTIKRVPKKKKNRKKKNIPKMILEDKSLSKYWHKRFSLFSRFDQGIRLDAESWFSVTPEKVAIHMAERLRCDTIIDGFCGSGGNAIQFALTCSKVIAVDIDPEKIRNARHNASIYGVANKIDFIVGDFLQLCSSLKGDVVFLSPPWGGPKYISAKEYDIEESLEPLGATALAEKSRQISENMVFFFPKNSKSEQIKKLAGVGNRVEIEHNYLNTRLVGLTAIYGDWLIDKMNLCK